jgi:hypothetical protein
MLVLLLVRLRCMACSCCRKLKQAAAHLLAPDAWSTLYSCNMVRTSRGRGFGMVVGTYNSGWHVFAAASGERCICHCYVIYMVLRPSAVRQGDRPFKP